MNLAPLLRSVSLLLVALTLTALSFAPRAAETIKIVGAGASFPAPIYLRWFRDYYLAHPNVKIDYQAIGSGGGVANFIKGMLDFAGSDVPMTLEQIAQVEGGVIQIPMTAGAIVIAYDLPGVDGLKLSRNAVAAIFLGEIDHWNDPLIASANPGVELPNMPIFVVTRGDASGTTFVTTRHLGAISQEFREKVGIQMNPVWPKDLQERGALLRGQGNGGVAAFIKAIPGSIGYIQHAYAHLTNMQTAVLQNSKGEYVPANGETFRAAVESFRADLDLSAIADPEGDDSYPILSLSWLILRKDYPDDKAAVIRDVVHYALTDGQKVADSLGYIPLTAEAAARLQKKINQIH
ncbi:phosphate ABC transporter substrate-binding protein PstS [Thiorhodococcus mannitoliphagus]|uniref:Phosphate-binding protein PstS n=1 Tax=Thiorhodococcus mannitoliphagus TaxID=329406 RepID=A0A6P1DMN0_9GAMM|nr:phosphate ABC transporter substrate-binding protein PstS [Thiorhodococcus mannitoliphagus]NEX19517.1 phosphate ABC transporter substrate-binding protein PstS [Thiorhodococcus mannitoliphagus]